MADLDISTAAPGIKRMNCDWGYCLDGKQEAIIAAGLAKPDWFEDGTRRNTKGQVVRTKHLEVEGRKIETTTRKGSSFCSMRISYTEQEKTDYEARETEREAKEQRKPDYRPPGLAHALTLRYPGVRIIDAYIRDCGDGNQQQNLSFQASLERLRECGLVTDAMLANIKDGYGNGVTPIGDGYSLSQDLFDYSTPGCFDLSIHTPSAPWRRERKSTREAARVLKCFMHAKNHKRMHSKAE